MLLLLLLFKLSLSKSRERADRRPRRPLFYSLNTAQNWLQMCPHQSQTGRCPPRTFLSFAFQRGNELYRPRSSAWKPICRFFAKHVGTRESREICGEVRAKREEQGCRLKANGWLWLGIEKTETQAKYFLDPRRRLCSW